MTRNANNSHYLQERAKQPRKNLSYEGVEFMDTNVNEILQRNISLFLKSAEFKSNANGISKDEFVIHNTISRSGYRLIEFPKKIHSEAAFLKNRDEILANPVFTYQGYCKFEGSYFLIVSQSWASNPPKWASQAKSYVLEIRKRITDI